MKMVIPPKRFLQYFESVIQNAGCKEKAQTQLENSLWIVWPFYKAWFYTERGLPYVGSAFYGEQLSITHNLILPNIVLIKIAKRKHHALFSSSSSLSDTMSANSITHDATT